jgi:hypothetical protein
LKTTSPGWNRAAECRGETPPAEGSTGGPQGHDEGGPPRGTQVAVLVVIGIVVLLCLLFFVGYIVGLL